MRAMMQLCFRIFFSGIPTRVPEDCDLAALMIPPKNRIDHKAAPDQPHSITVWR